MADVRLDPIDVVSADLDLLFGHIFQFFVGQSGGFQIDLGFLGSLGRLLEDEIPHLELLPDLVVLGCMVNLGLSHPIQHIGVDLRPLLLLYLRFDYYLDLLIETVQLL